MDCSLVMKKVKRFSRCLANSLLKMTTSSVKRSTHWHHHLTTVSILRHAMLASLHQSVWQQMGAWVDTVVSALIVWNASQTLARICRRAHHQPETMLCQVVRGYIPTGALARMEWRLLERLDGNLSVISNHQLKLLTISVVMWRVTVVFLQQTTTLKSGSYWLLDKLIYIFCWISCSPENTEIQSRKSSLLIFHRWSWRTQAASTPSLCALILSTKFMSLIVDIYDIYAFLLLQFLAFDNIMNELFWLPVFYRALSII